jgi:hypothetical protein
VERVDLNTLWALRQTFTKAKATSGNPKEISNGGHRQKPPIFWLFLAFENWRL